MTVTAPDNATSRSAELWIAYHRKAIFAAAPVLLAVLNVLRDAATTANGIDASSVVLAVLAGAGLIATYYPSNAVAKLIASGLMAIGAGITAAITDGLSSASLLLVFTQFLAWAAAGATANGARPDVVIGELADAPADEPAAGDYVFPTDDGR